MTIKTFRIKRVQGESHDWSRLNLVKSHVDALNEIGRTGAYQGNRMLIQDYLDSLSKKRLLGYRVEKLSENKEEFTDELMIIQVTP
jgi:hypothetical protein